MACLESWSLEALSSSNESELCSCSTKLFELNSTTTTVLDSCNAVLHNISHMHMDGMAQRSLDHTAPTRDDAIPKSRFCGDVCRSSW